YERGAHRAEEEEDDEPDDQHCLAERLRDLLERIAHEHRAVPDETHLDVARQRRLDALHLFSQLLRDLELVRAGQRPDTEIHALLVVVLRDRRGLLRTELDGGDIAQANDRAVAIRDDEILELFDSPQIRVREQVHLNEIALRLP